MTDAERLLWRKLRRKQLCGAQFRRQVPFGSYIADFVCHESKLVIEVDGGQHGSCKGRSLDQPRTEFLTARGYRVLRYWNSEVFDNIDGVVTDISIHLVGAVPHRQTRQA